MDYPKEPPPPYGMNVPPPQQPTVQKHVIVTQIINTPALGPEEQAMNCPRCHQDMVTRVSTESTVLTHTCALILCLIFFPLVCIPYCCDSCKATKHYCSKCGAFVGAYTA